jgi:uncharacterized protein YkwD
MRPIVRGALLLLSACGAAPAQGPEPTPAPSSGASGSPSAPESAPSPIAPAAEAEKGPLSRADAERYVLRLINRDRAAQGLSAVRWDEPAAQAGRRHARDLVAHMVTSHVGTDGSVPEQRYTEAGGRGMVMENAACTADGTVRAPDPEARFAPESLAILEKGFMDEVPPHDGHRRNILRASHNAVGIGLAQPRQVELPCLVQEFVDDYGSFEELPAKAKPGQVIAVVGAVRAPATVAGVGLGRIDLPRPKKAAELAPRGYPIPAPYQMYWPAGFVTPIVLETDPGQHSFEVKEPAMVSLRTIEVR